jgi:anthranilate phosphoribosyltransferase
MNQAFIPFIQAVGRGQKSGRFLTEDEAYCAMTMLLNQEVSELQKGAFLMLLRVREESIEELTGFVRACKDTMNPVAHSVPEQLIDWGCYAGKRRQLPWFILAMSILIENGYKVLAHGAHEPESQRLYLDTVLKTLGIYDMVVSFSVDQALQRVSSHSFSFLSLQHAHPQLHELIQLRASLGLRSCANTLARLLNPSGAKYSIQGVHHKGVDIKHQLISQALDNTNTLCFRGEGGEPEISPSKSTELYICRGKDSEKHILAPVQNWQMKPRKLDANALLTSWQGEETHPYGENSVLSTLTSVLILVEGMPQSDAIQKASRLWQRRNKAYFLGMPINEMKIDADLLAK